ncbi:MAG: PfaD family polyunsaturated fatty acid/polyketide biosynthesis protein, partial [Candidatus Xenobia bacterium]
IPALRPQQLGDPAFLARHGVRLPCVSGAMANGIASVDLVEAMARAGMLAFFGAAGLSPERVEAAIDALQRRLPELPFGFNLIHSPDEPQLEDRVAATYQRRGIRRVCAAAFLTLTLPVVRYRFSGIHRDVAGRIVTPNHVFAKVSRNEVARKFLSPPPADMLAALVEQGALTADQATLAATLPVAEDVTAEADSGGHTDNRPAFVLLPAMLALRDEIQAQHRYEVAPRVGAAGGIATPTSAAAAFSMGAAYVMTGSINQACVESGSSDVVREMLCKASPADVAMAPAADMFEMGVKVQVLKWGTMFPVRARKLYDLYRGYGSLQDLPAEERTVLERDYFRSTLEEAWQQTAAFFATRDPRQVERANQDPKHKMALVFRSYLGRSSKWANEGEPTRKVDYQIWCGPAMGAFNEWVRGSFLEHRTERRVATVNLNLMLGAAVMMRTVWLRSQGVPVPPELSRFIPLPAPEVEGLLA